MKRMDNSLANRLISRFYQWSNDVLARGPITEEGDMILHSEIEILVRTDTHNEKKNASSIGEKWKKMYLID